MEKITPYIKKFSEVEANTAIIKRSCALYRQQLASKKTPVFVHPLLDILLFWLGIFVLKISSVAIKNVVSMCAKGFFNFSQLAERISYSFGEFTLHYSALICSLVLLGLVLEVIRKGIIMNKVQRTY